MAQFSFNLRVTAETHGVDEDQVYQWILDRLYETDTVLRVEEIEILSALEQLAEQAK